MWFRNWLHQIAQSQISKYTRSIRLTKYVEPPSVCLSEKECVTYDLAWAIIQESAHLPCPSSRPLPCPLQYHLPSPTCLPRSESHAFVLADRALARSLARVAMHS